MGKPCSLDLRERVIAAVEVEGMSRNQAASRFAVAPSSAIKWVARFRASGSAAPGKMGGHKPKTLRGAHAEEAQSGRAERSALNVSDRLRRAAGFVG